MKATFESEDSIEIARLAKANDMANCLFELKHNAWREFKHTDYDYSPAWEKILSVLDEYRIGDELW